MNSDVNIRKTFNKIHKNFPEIIDRFGLQVRYKKITSTTVCGETLYNVPIENTIHIGNAREFIKDIKSLQNLLETMSKLNIIVTVYHET